MMWTLPGYLSNLRVVPLQELSFEVSLGLNRKNADVHLLTKEVLRSPRSLSILEKGKGPEDFLLVAAELLQGQVQI